MAAVLLTPASRPRSLALPGQESDRARLRYHHHTGKDETMFLMVDNLTGKKVEEVYCQVCYGEVSQSVGGGGGSGE